MMKVVALLTMTDVIGVGMIIAELTGGVIIAIIYIQITAWFIVVLIVIF
jgi:hypothetical protein